MASASQPNQRRVAVAVALLVSLQLEFAGASPEARINHLHLLSLVNQLQLFLHSSGDCSKVALSADRTPLEIFNHLALNDIVNQMWSYLCFLPETCGCISQDPES